MADDNGALPDLDALVAAATYEPRGTSGDEDAPTRTRKPRADKGQPRGPRGARRTTTNKLATELLDPLAKLAQGLAFVAPTAAAVIVSRGEKVTNALVEIAKDKPRMLAALQRVSQIGPASDLVEFGFMMFIAIQLDSGHMPPTHPLAVVTGVNQLYARTHQTTETPAESGAMPTFTVPPPPMPNDPRHPLFTFQAGRGAGARSE